MFKALMAGLLVAPILTATLVTTTATVSGQATAILSTDECSSGVTAAGTQLSGAPLETDPSQDKMAQILYETALREGLGPNAALLLLFVGHEESNWSQTYLPDAGVPGNTSRGVLRQLEGWAGKTAWSGLEPPKGVRPGDYFVKENAWGSEGWATNDRRMNPVKASELFLDSLRVHLEAADISIEQFNAAPLTDEELLYWSADIQNYAKDNPNVQSNLLDSIDPARQMFKKLSEGTDVTISPVDMSSSRFNGNGVLMIGDSLMQGISGNAPEQDFGGPIQKVTEVGISLAGINKALQGRSTTPDGQDWSTVMESAPSRVYVSAGTNSPGSATQFASEIDQFMRLVGPNRTVYWNTLQYAPVDKYNKVLNEATNKYPNLRLVPIEKVVEPSEYPERNAADGVHFTPEGYAEIWKLARNSLGGVIGATVVAAGRDPCLPAHMLTSGSAQTVIGPDGCPTSVPNGTLFDGAEKMDIAAMCAEAVAQAPTPQAAAAIKWAFGHLGIPYACTKGLPYGSGRWIGYQTGKNYGSQGGARQGPEFYDCSSFVAQAYYETSGLPIRAHSTHSMVKGASANYEARNVEERMAGDLVVSKSSGSASGQHVVMYIGRIDGQEWMIHTNACGSVSKVERYSNPQVIRNVARPIPKSVREEQKINERLGLSL